MLKGTLIKWRSVVVVPSESRSVLGTFTTDTASQLDVFRHNGHSLGVNSAQVGVLKKADQIGLGGFLKFKNAH